MISKRMAHIGAGLTLLGAAACSGGKTASHETPKPTASMKVTPSPTAETCVDHLGLLLFRGQGLPLSDPYDRDTYYVENLGADPQTGAQNTILLKHSMTTGEQPEQTDASQLGFFNYPDYESATVTVNDANQEAIVDVTICGPKLPQPTASA